MGTKKEMRKAEALTSQTYNGFYTRLRLLAISRFEWLNLPATCDARFLEKVLCDDGRAIFVNDPLNGGFLTLRCSPHGALNIYENPLHYQAWSLGYSKIVDPNPSNAECVRIRNNPLDIPTDFTLQLFAKRLTEAERTTDVNITAQKTPILIVGTDKQRQTLELLYQVWDGNNPFIFGVKDLIPEQLKSLKTDAPFVADKLQDYKDKIWNEALTFLGIDTNPQPDKRERMLTNEVDSNNALTDLCSNSMLLSRKMACDEINKMFPDLPAPVSVRMRKLYDIETEEIDDGTGGKNNE